MDTSKTAPLSAGSGDLQYEDLESVMTIAKDLVATLEAENAELLEAVKGWHAWVETAEARIAEEAALRSGEIDEIQELRARVRELETEAGRDSAYVKNLHRENATLEAAREVAANNARIFFAGNKRRDVQLNKLEAALREIAELPYPLGDEFAGIPRDIARRALNEETT